MESIALKPRQAQIKAMVIALGVLCAVSITAPMLAAPAALLMPLFGCPLVKHKEEWLGWLASAVPAAASLIKGFDIFFSASLLLPGMLPMLVTRLVPPKGRFGAKGLSWYLGTTALSMTAVAAVLTWRLGGPIAQVLPQRIIDWIGQSDTPGLTLYRLASAGLLSVPEGYRGNEVLMHLLEPAIIRQMLLSLRLTLEMLFSQLLPSLFMQGCILLGLFTALRVEHLNGIVLLVETDAQKPSERKTHVAAPPGFRLLTLPKSLRWPVAVMAVCSILTLGGSGVTGMLGTLCYSAFATIFQLQGAAVAVYVFGKHYPNQITAVGAIVGAVYAIAPMALLLIGITDQAMHYRTHNVRPTDET